MLIMDVEGTDGRERGEEQVILNSLIYIIIIIDIIYKIKHYVLF